MGVEITADRFDASLNESPSEKEGKLKPKFLLSFVALGLNESPSEKEGKSLLCALESFTGNAPQ